MKEFEIGGKITLSENERYIILDVIEKESEKYYFCCTQNKPIIPAIFERIDMFDSTYIKSVNDEKILKEIGEKIINENQF